MKLGGLLWLSLCYVCVAGDEILSKSWSDELTWAVEQYEGAATEGGKQHFAAVAASCIIMAIKERHELKAIEHTLDRVDRIMGSEDIPNAIMFPDEYEYALKRLGARFTASPDELLWKGRNKSVSSWGPVRAPDLLSDSPRKLVAVIDAARVRIRIILEGDDKGKSGENGN